jgi:hypothetical protein
MGGKMKVSNRSSLIIVCITFFTIILYFTTFCFSADDIIRAKIGIQIKSQDKTSMAKSRERLKSGDLLRIYVHPENPAYIYVVYSDKNEVTLLNIVEQKVVTSSLVLPSVNQYYLISGTSNVERFTIICSPAELPQIDNLLNSDKPLEKWTLLEKDLVGKSRIVLKEKTVTPFAIAGNVRSYSDSETNNSFVKKLHIFSGKSFVVKQYEFRVKK